uniref:Uncharacterized protein n=2 Tax=Graphocephala atropunctata TaxID=36148 RepID=A0A1B6KJZ9_9HEMI
MEKASTPRNRLTRSAAKQVNTPSNNVDQDDQISNEDLKPNVRRTRRKTNTKMKTNGDALICSPQTPNNAVENKRLKSNEEISDGNSFDGYDSENSNLSSKQNNSPKLSYHKTPSPTISRKSLRTRRSITPGPELESSASKRMKRSTSEGKMDSLCTPTNRRGMRAKSESKDFKPKSTDFDKLSSESCNRYNPKLSTLRVIEKIVEANEGDDSSHDDEPLTNLIGGAKSQKEHTEQDKSCGDLSQGVPNSELRNHDSTPTEVLISETHSEIAVCNTRVELNNSEEGVAKKENQEQEECHNTKPNLAENTFDSIPMEQVAQKTEVFETSAIIVKVDSKDSENTEDKLSISASFSEETVEPTVQSAETPSKDETICPDIYKENEAHAITEEENEKCDSDSIEIDIIAVDSNSLEAPLKPSIEAKNCHKQSTTSEMSAESSIVTQTDNVLTENNNINPISLQLETDSLDDPNDKVLSDSNKVNISFKSNTSVKDMETKNLSISSNSEKDTCHKDNDDSNDIFESPDNNDPDKNEDVENEGDLISNIHLDNKKPIEDDTECSKEFEQEHNKKNSFELHANQSQQCNDDLSDSVLIEESEDSPTNENSGNQVCYVVEEIDVSESCNVEIRNDTTENIEFIQSGFSENLEQHAQNLMEQDQSVFDKRNEGAKQIMDEHNENELAEIKDDSNVVKETEQDETLVLESPMHVNQENEHQLDNNYEDNNYDEDRISNEERNYDSNQDFDEDENDKEHKKYKGNGNFDEEKFKNETSNKIDSGSDSDIYKDMSDFGTDGDEQKEGSQFNDSASSELGSGDSEEYRSSVEEEELEEGVLEEEDENNANEENQECLRSNKNNEQCERKDDISHDIKDGEKFFDNDNPITYDKALAILNKNRVKKIDDEEFFDMFTEELNRVSGKSDSDSDIAIVDEYIMEPEETTSKPSKHPGNPPGNSKPPIQRPNKPLLTRPKLPPPGFYFNQQRPPRITMPRMNFRVPNFNPHNIPIRGPVMFNQIPPPNQPMLDPRMFNTQVPPDVNYSTAVFNHPMGPNTQMGYPRAAPPLKVRSVNAMNSSQLYNEMDRSYAGLQTEATSALETNTSMSGENRGNLRCAATMTETDENLGKTSSSSASRNSGIKSVSTPILNLLGLDKQKLKQLKQVLGINKKKSFHILKKDSCERKRKGRRKFRKSSKQSESAFKKSLVKQIIDSDSATFTDKRLMRPSDVQSSSETSSDDQRAFLLRSRKDASSLSSSESESDRTETPDRKVNLLGGNPVSVTFPSQRAKNARRFRKKRQYESSSESIPTILEKKKKYNATVISDTELKVQKKMTQKKKENTKKSTFVKSNCGTFTVDGVTASSQSSDSEMLSQEEQIVSPSEDYHLQELNKIRKDVKSGRNRLSNMFSQHNISKDLRGNKESERENITRKRKRSKVKKLPTEILDTLSSDEDSAAKMQQSADSGSDEAVTVPRKKHKKGSRKAKVKSGISGESYVPCVTAGATQFGLSRLDKVAAHTLKAAQFRSDQLYGASVKRITIMDFSG